MELPDWLADAVPEDLEDAVIAGGETHPPVESVRLNGPPGTGKTTQQALRVAYLIEEEGTDPDDITLVTYRRALANAVEKRLKAWGVLDEDEELKYWTTIHAAANRANKVLSGDSRQNNSGLGPAVTGREKYVFCEQVLNVDFVAARPWEDTRGQLLMDTFGWMRNNLLNPADQSDVRQCPHYEDLKTEWPGVDVPTLWGQYEDWKAQHGLCDFWEILEEAQTGELPPTDVVVIDEYHDATPLMASVSERWIDAAGTAIVAGDPLQVVNAYAGASPRFFTERLDDLPEILLDTSFRVPEEHWQAATYMLEKEFNAPPVKRDGRGEIRTYRSPIFEHDSYNDEWRVPGESLPGSPAGIWADVIEGTENRSVLYLARTQKQAAGISRALDKAGIIHDAQDDVGGWNGRRLRLYNALRKLERVPRTYANETHGAGLNRYTGDTGDAANVRLTADQAAVMIEHANAATLDMSRSDAEALAARIRDDEVPMRIDDLEEHVRPEFWQTYTSAEASVSELLKAGEIADHDKEALKRALARNTGLATDLSGTRVLTIHASKGSEATDVVVYDGITATIAGEMERSEKARRNEARSWYVALSRASERLHLMYDGFDWMQPFLPKDLAQRAARAAQRHAPAVTDGGETR
ncbi:UvrD-helicase domain-containing protein [Natrarchaeobaculum sulfurireducens]|uniref:DNA 3'-5' helicase n=1 Tax=Natrarchaeobaculum sulfurireducens TaxID=2044521 RepID=A0A346PMH6_9EURY|nr:UvrD-helicase domain-containing protein [Natrarchaeobaculum sulfurireducens]AXR80721.1 ATP-dependent DNA helicase pcrA [Natrarchaeobaculum sulfurireducens]